MDIFFVLSGFLITGILFDTRYDKNRVRNFYVRRSLRIFPLYYGVLLFFVSLQPLAHWLISWKWLVWPAYLGKFVALFPYHVGSSTQEIAEFRLTHGPHGLHFPSVNLGHFWSLCVEEQFYLVWPWLVFNVRKRGALLWMCALCLPIVLSLRIIASHYLPPWMVEDGLLYRATPFRIDSLLLGGWLALILRGKHAELVKRMGRWLFWPCWMVAVALAAAFSQPSTTWVLTYGILIVDLLALLLVLNSLETKTAVGKVLSLLPFRWVGRLTYGAYVFHDMFHAAYMKAGSMLSQRYPALAGTLIAATCTFAVAWLSFRLVESRFIALKDSWTKAEG